MSILIAVYNGEKPSYLRDALESIRLQTLSPLEVVLVQDGPISKELYEIIEEFRQQTGFLKLISQQKNLGLSSALRLGLAHCRTEYVARMDTDDIALPNRLEMQATFLAGNPDVDVLGSWASVIDEYGLESGKILTRPVEHAGIVKSIWSCPILHPTVVFRKDTVLRAGGYDAASGPRQDDYDLWFRCCGTGAKFANIPRPLLKYRVGPDSAKKNGVSVGWARLKVGWRGCRSLQLGPVAYIGVAFPLLRALLPNIVRRKMINIADVIDPRRVKFRDHSRR